MTPLKTTGLLGGLTVIAIVLLTSLTSANVLLSPSIRNHMRAACQSAPDVSSCLLFADVLTKADTGDSYIKDVSRILKKVYDVKSGPTRKPKCNECIEQVQDIESYLATNETVGNIMQALEGVCVAQYSGNPTQQTACLEAVGEVPALADRLLANAPPLTMCTIIKACTN